jgi:hypothetical protein
LAGIPVEILNTLIIIILKIKPVSQLGQQNRIVAIIPMAIIASSSVNPSIAPQRRRTSMGLLAIICG